VRNPAENLPSRYKPGSRKNRQRSLEKGIKSRYAPREASGHPEGWALRGVICGFLFAAKYNMRNFQEQTTFIVAWWDFNFEPVLNRFLSRLSRTAREPAGRAGRTSKPATLWGSAIQFDVHVGLD
jgi:hypothetical protein